MSDFPRGVITALAILSPLLIRLALYGIVSWWKRQFIRRAILTRFILEDVQERLLNTGKESQRYSQKDPEPYGSSVIELENVLVNAKTEYSIQVQQRSRLFRKIPNPPKEWLDLFLFGWWSEPLHWYRIHREVEMLLISIQNLQTTGLYAEQILEDLHRKPVEVSDRIIDLRRTDTKVLNLSRTLSEVGICGDTIESTKKNLEHLHKKLIGLPTWFHQESENLILQRSRERFDATKNAAILAWKTLNEIEVPIRQHLERLQSWHSKYRELRKLVQGMRKSVETTKQRLSELPPSIDVTSMAKEVQQLSDEARQVEEQYDSPTIERLGRLSDWAQQVRKTATQLTKQTNYIKEQYDQLCQLISLNSKLLVEIAGNMDELTQEQAYPVCWQHSQAEINYLRKIEATIGEDETQRTPASLEEHLDLASELQDQAKTLSSTVSEVRRQRKRIVSLLEQPSLIVGVKIDHVKNLYERVKEYAPENWSEDVSVVTIQSEARILAKRQEALIPQSSDIPLQEQHIPQRVKGLQNLEENIIEFRDQVQQIEETLDFLQRTEQQARQNLESVLKVLSRSQFLDTELSSLQETGDILMSNLQRRSVGKVLEKAKSIEEWVDKCNRELSHRRKDLRVRTNDAMKHLQNKVRQLQEIASFDQEQAMIEAKKLLMVNYAFEAPSIAQAAETEIEQLVSEMNKLSEREAALHNSIDELIMNIDKPLEGCVKGLRQVRQRASDRYARLRKVYKEAKSNWPPVTCNMSGVDTLWQRAKGDSKGLEESGVTVAYVLSRTDRLIERYEDVIDKINDKLEEIESKQHDLDDIQIRIEHWIEDLKAFRDERSHDTAIVKAVRDRLTKIDETLAEAKREHRNRLLSYEEARNRLKEVWQIAYYPLHVNRGNTVQTIAVGDILSGGSVRIEQSARF